MNLQQLLQELAGKASEKHKANVVRLGIPEANSLGVPVPAIRALARSTPKSNELAWELWGTGIHEARLLACLIFEPATLSHEQLQLLVNDVRSWDLCDHLCGSVFLHDRYYPELISRWADAEATYEKRAAFALIATASTHARNLDNSLVTQWLELIEQQGADDRLHVKKAVSWALREVAHLDLSSRDTALAVATRMLGGPGKAGQWIGRDALKEIKDLVSVPGRRRLVSAQSKAAQAAGF